MAQIVKLRRSSVSGQKPTNSNLQLGELALNTTDGKVFFAKSGSLGPTVEELVSTNTVNTGSIHLTGDITGSIFTGSFKGDGSQLYNIPSSGVTGLELNKIVSGSVSASISPDRGLEINTDVTISGSFPPGSPSSSLKVFGNTEIDGYAKFLPVTANLDNSITGSYIFVSGSTDDLYFAQNGNGFSNVTRLRWLEGNLYTGLLNGGNITATNGGTTFNISAGSGIIVNLNASLTDNPYPTIKYVNWNSFTGQTLTYRTTNIQTYIAIDENAQIVQSNTPFVATQYNTLITIGTVIHQNLSTVNASITYPNVAYGYKQRTYDFVKAFGPLKLSGLNLITTGSLGLNVGSGTAFAEGRNYQTDPNNPSYITDSGTAVSKIFRYYQVSGTTFVQDTNNGAGYSGIDPTKYVLNGVLTDVGGDYSIQRVFWYPNSATKGIVVYYGNAKYSTIRDAIDNLNVETFNETENTKQNAVLLGTIIIAGNGDFTQPNKYSIVPGGLFRSIGGSGGGGNIPTSRLFDLSDVDVVNQQDNDLLVYNVNTLKWESTNILQGEYTVTGSFTGSFIGDGSGLYNVPASGVTGLNLSQIADGSATASISNTNGFRVNTNSEITGSMFISGPLNIGDIPVYGDPLNPEVVHIHNSGSYNGIVALGNTETFYQTYIANTNSGSSASTDLIIGADNVTDNSYYVDLGINSSTYNAGYVGYENDSYLYAASDDLYIGTIGLLGNSSDIHIFTSNSWQNPQITVSGSGQIGFNTQTVDPGRQYQFSGSAKFNNGARFEESIDVQYDVTAGNYVDTPKIYHNGNIVIDTNGNNVNVTGSLNVSGTITAQEIHTTFVTSSILYESGSTKFGNSLDDTHTFSGSILVHTLLETNRISPVSGVDVTIESSNLKVPNGGIYTDFNIESKGTISATSISGNTITGSIISGSFIGDATNLINVPFHITGSDVDGNTYDKTFTKLHFDSDTGLNVSESVAGTAFISIGSHFKDIFVSGSPVLSATGSDAFEIIGLGGIHISSSTVDTNGNGYVKELTFDLTEISSSLDSRITALTGSTGGGISDGGYATLNQSTLSATWSFNHNLGQRYPIIQVFDSDGKVIIPSEIIMNNSSNATITFPNAQSGKAVASLGVGPGGMTQFFTSATTWSLQHDLGADYPIVTIYDTNKNIILPDRVTSIDSNNIEIGFTTPIAGHLNVAKGGHIISGSINFSNISTVGSGIVSSSIQVYNYGYATTGSNAFNGSQLIKNAKIDATCLSVTTGTSTIFTVSGYDGATFDYVVKNGVNRRAGTIVAIWDGLNSKFTETTTPDLGDTSNVTFTVSSTGALNAIVSSGTWTVEAMYRALNCS